MILHNLGWLLHNCSKTKSLLHGRSIQASLIKQCSQSDVFLSNHLLNMYAKCCKITEALQVFDEMTERNLVSWSAMISGCDQSGEHSMALNLFSQMRLEPNEFIYASVISACSSLLALIQGQQVHAQTLKTGYDSVSFVSNSLMSMYMNCRLCNDAFSIFSEKSEVTSVVSYNSMIKGFAENSQPQRGLKVFDLMVERGVIPDLFSFVGVFGICSDTKDLKRGIQLHSRAVKLGFDVTAFVGNVILTMYSKCNLIEEAEKIFTSIEEKDVISWNTIISACSHCGDYARSLIFFREMMREDIVGVRIDDFTLASALAACARLALIRMGDEIHAHIIRTCIELDVGVGNALVNMYAKCGNIGCASIVFNRMMQHNLVSWNTIIAAFGNHGLGRRAIEMFEHMEPIGVKPDSVTFIGLLIACNHAGLVDEGRAYFNSMKDVYGLVPEIEHFSCLVDLLGRAGRLEEAKQYLEKFPVYGNDLVVLGSLLSACRLRGDVVVAEWVSRRLLDLQPVTSSPYVLLSNLYASDGKWAGVAEARKLLKDSGVKKEPGHSLIEVNGKIKKFTAGDFLHSNMQDMKDILRSFTWVVSNVSVV